MSEQQILYHGSPRHVEPGTVMAGRGDRYENEWGSNDFYWILELYRPKDKLPQRDAVFMVGNIDDIDLACGCTDWCLEVRPGEILSKHDINWSAEISSLVSDGHDHKSEAVRKAAENYWNGVPHHNESVWEYLTESVTVEKSYALDAAPEMVP